jgi:hypothetical protein
MDVDQEPGLKHMKTRTWLHAYTIDDAAHKSGMENKRPTPLAC